MSYSPNFRGAPITTVENAAVTGGTVTNTTGVSLARLTPVKLNTSGVISEINVSLDDTISVAGVITEQIFNGSVGFMASTGTIKDINVSFDLGDTVYVSKTGLLTNIKPSTDVNGFAAGDYIIRVGVIGKNESNSSKIDLHLSMDVVGQL